MSITQDTYEAALVAVLAALDALADNKGCIAKAQCEAGNNYDNYRATMAIGEHAGASSAASLIHNMLREYRTGGAA